MGSDCGGPDASTNNPSNNPPKEESGGGVQQGIDAAGVKEKGVPGWRWPRESEELGSGSRGPDASQNNPPNDPSKEESGGNGNNDGGSGVKEGVDAAGGAGQGEGRRRVGAE